MSKYYELSEDLYIQGRWVLDGPIDDDLRDEREFKRGQPVVLRGALCAPIHTPGMALDFTFTLSHIPVLSARFAAAVRPLIEQHTQLFPVHIDGYEGFVVMNATSIVCCLDEARSEFQKWTEEDGRPNKIGQYQMVTKLRLDPSQIPQNLHIFRVMGWKIALIVSQAFVDAIMPLKPTGVKLEVVV